MPPHFYWGLRVRLLRQADPGGLKIDPFRFLRVYMSKHGLAALAAIFLASILATLPITIGESATFGLMRAFAQQGPLCADGPSGSPTSTTGRPCARWQCVRRGKCQVLAQGQRTGQTTPFEWVWRDGCLKFYCAAAERTVAPVPSAAPVVCPPNYIRMAGRCVPNQQRIIVR